MDEPEAPACPPQLLAVGLTLYIRRLCTPFKPLLAYGGTRTELRVWLEQGQQKPSPSSSGPASSCHVLIDVCVSRVYS